MIEAVQQSEIGQKRKVDGALNPKRSEFLSVKNNCGTASKMLKTKVNREAVIYSTNGLPYSCREEEGVEF